MNIAADFLSRLDVDPKEKVWLQIKEDIRTTPIQVNIKSSDIHEEDQFYFLSEDDSETEEEIWERKQRARKNCNHTRSNSPTPKTTPQILKRRTYHWSVTTYKTQTENSGGNYRMTRTCHAA